MAKRPSPPKSDAPPSHGELLGHLEMLASLGRGFLTSLKVEETLHEAVAHIASHLKAEAGSLFLLDETGEKLVCRACVGPVDITGLTLLRSQGIVGRCVERDCGEIVRNVAKDPAFARQVDAKTGFSTRSILCAPLSFQGERIGAIQMLNKSGGRGFFSASDLRLLEALAAVAALAVLNARMASSLVEQDRIQRDLELAARIQRDLLPPTPPEGAPVQGVNHPARAVSGDFFDFLTLADGRIWFTLADVSGKGVRAALLAAKVSSLFHSLARDMDSPAALLARINQEMVERPTHGMFVTLAAGLLDPRQGLVRLCNAGHEPPLLLSREGDFTAFAAQDPPLGILSSPPEGYAEERFSLEGGTLYLFSDGLTEGRTAGGSMLGQEGLRARLLQLRHLPLSRRLPAVLAPLLMEAHALHDDLTLLGVEDPAAGRGPGEEAWHG